MGTKKPVVAVVGATGAQGGGLVRALLADPEARFAARAVTRDPGAPAARALAALGAEVVQADLADEESLARAFEGAHGAFCVTFFWAHLSPEQELAHARNLAGAARAARVSHVVWSTLEDTRRLVPLDDPRMPTLQGRYKVPHYAYRALPFAGAADLGNMFQVKHDFEREYCAARRPEDARALLPELQTFAAWLSRNAGRIPLDA